MKTLIPPVADHACPRPSEREDGQYSLHCHHVAEIIRTVLAHAGSGPGFERDAETAIGLYFRAVGVDRDATSEVTP